MGRLYVLGADPKPDMKAPCDHSVTELSAGLAMAGMSYDDLILSLLADQVDILLRNDRGCPGHLRALLSNFDL